jgi:hypothetical protein
VRRGRVHSFEEYTGMSEYLARGERKNRWRKKITN